MEQKTDKHGRSFFESDGLKLIGDEWYVKSFDHVLLETYWKPLFVVTVDRNSEWNEGYEVGYREGGNDVRVDWEQAILEEFGVEVEGPDDLVRKIKEGIIH